jgi:hypothetical protein
VEDGQPAATFRIEALWRDGGQTRRRGRVAVFAVDTQELADRGLARPGEFAAHAAQPLREHGSHASEPLRSESCDPLESAIVRGGLEVFERLEIQLVMQPGREAAADARHGREETHRVGIASQALEHRRVPEPHDVPDRPCETLANTWQAFQRLDASPIEKISNRFFEPTQRGRASLVRADTKGIGTLAPEQRRHFVQLHCHRFVQRVANRVGNLLT